MDVFSLLLTSVLFKRNSNTMFFQYPEQSLNNSLWSFCVLLDMSVVYNKCFKKTTATKTQAFNVKTIVVDSAEMAQW